MRTFAIAFAALLAATPVSGFAAQPPGGVPVAIKDLPPEPKESGATIESGLDADRPAECYIAATNRTCGLAGQISVNVRCGCKFGNGPVSVGRTR